MYATLLNALTSNATLPVTPPEIIVMTDCAATAPVLPFYDLYTRGELKEPGVTQIWQDVQGLHVCALVVDSCPHSRAKPGDPTWECGDVIEFFWQPDAQKKPYFEFHVAPNQVTLQFAIPDAEQHVAGAYSFDSLCVETPLVAEAQIFANGAISGWIATFDLPADFVLDKMGDAQEGRFAICRYNERQDNTLELSSTCHFPTPRFHQPACWHRLKYVKI